jgi:hypothetical protein
MLTLRRVSLHRESGRSPREPRPPGAAGALQATLEFAASAREPGGLDRIALLPSEPIRVAAVDDAGRRLGGASAVLAVTEEGTQLVVRVGGLDPSARGLGRLEGSLPLYPAARRVRFHVPWLKDELPTSSEVDGARATLERMKLAGNDYTLWVRITPPPGLAMVDARRGGLKARAVDIDGNFLNGGGIAETEVTAGGAEPQVRFFAPGLRRNPSRLMLDVVFASGEPAPAPFRFKAIRFAPLNVYRH